MTPTLIACSHGTGDERGRAAIRALVDQVRQRLAGVRVEEAFVDVQEPSIDDVVDRCAAGAPVVVVPVLLSTGFHTKVDIARAVAAHPGRAVAAPPLGPHGLLVEVLQSRLAEIDAGSGDAVVLAAAGSSDPAAAADVHAVAHGLGLRSPVPVRVGFAAGAGPRISDAVDAARRAGARRVSIASYVLAPGYFASVIAAGGGDSTTPPLAPDPRIAQIIVERYRHGVIRLEQSGESGRRREALLLGHADH
jgi:sirohydrochlorin ferrochelatase